MDASLWILVLFFVLLLLGMPIAFVLGIAGVTALLLQGDLLYLSLVPQRMFAGLNMFTIMAIPFFFLAAELMTAARITEDLIKFADAIVGRIKGGLAHVNIVASMFFAGISGSAISDVAGLGSIEIRVMTKAGYPLKFAAALTVASSLIGPMIPPSIIMVIYGSIMQVSVAAMFLGGLVPGILMALMLMAMVHVMAEKHNFPRRTEKMPLREVWLATKNAFFALMMPGIILGGILSGVFTATEAAAVAVLYAFLIGFFVKRTLRLSHLPKILHKVSVLTSVVFMVLASASIVAWYIGLERLPEGIAKAMTDITKNPYLLLLLVNVLLLIVGMFMDIGAAVIVMAPILAPTMVDFGVHPVHFGIVMSINLLLGLNTPPVGPCLFAAASITRLRIEEISMALLPMYLLQVVFLLLVTYIPALTLTLPRWFGYIN
jgi:tripartite ATP-independent transporter DctM subunit